MANAIPGKAFLIRFAGILFECNTDLNFTDTANTETADACKPSPDEDWEEGMYQTPTVSDKAWTADGTFKVTDAVVNNQISVLNTIKVGTRDTLEIFTNVDSPNSPIGLDMVVMGEALLTEFSLGAPTAGEATYNLSFQGYGGYTVTAAPVTT